MIRLFGYTLVGYLRNQKKGRMIKKSNLINKITIYVVTLFILTLVFSGYANSQNIFEIEAILSPSPPVFVDEGDSISTTVDFGHEFTSIERICFIFFFVDDLLDPGDHLFFGPFIGGTSGFGFINGSPSAMSSRTICIIRGGHPEVMLFLDGQQNFNIVMEQGSVILSSLKVQITGKSTTLVDIDIKPGSDPNSINCTNDNGVIPVAILTTDDFDATTVDHNTVTFEGASETHVDRRSGDPRRHEEDMDGDGDTDLVFHFRLGDTELDCDSSEGTLIGKTFDGQSVEGTNSVNMIGSEVSVTCPCGDAKQIFDKFEQLELAVGGPLECRVFGNGAFIEQEDCGPIGVSNCLLLLAGRDFGTCTYALEVVLGDPIHFVTLGGLTSAEAESCISDITALIDQVDCVPIIHP